MQITTNTRKGKKKNHKSKLPYHAKKNVHVTVVMATNSPCHHALVQHMEGGGKNGRKVMHSWGNQCTRKTKDHKLHKDSTGRTWK